MKIIHITIILTDLTGHCYNRTSLTQYTILEQFSYFTYPRNTDLFQFLTNILESNLNMRVPQKVRS